MTLLDPTTHLGRRAAQRLGDEQVVWLTTVDPAGVPQPTPVWFWWTGDEAYVVSRPRQAKLRNVRAHPTVALSFNTDARGDDVQVLTGTAAVADGPLPADVRAAFDAKYAGGLRHLGMTAEDFHADYSVVLRVTPERVRGW
ncbi:TIGR03667 family PPOX class F420-dependent oxidoreductase [Cellulomonas sp. JZ18]|uniref:TIGR03667 family PPOX class F420-dependent oxidoreductase n=1 Tax=Cellulomonas sp. JZ18 TaxID=2654191 RepID=UPI0012D436B9|nr:TIGR03667 family PPOX class F420-dependent oxidoreductase [Cellulomonas sp. JZ18]QGQ20274.1 TIGR03667 family PPOX class F420-dependent oxidoreductase [Cellulomonas sp. JZ18]